MALIAFTGAPAQSLLVEYSEGSVEVMSGSVWSTVGIGDAIGAEATIRLEGSASLELSASGSKITLSQPGIYAVKALLSAARDIDASGVGRLLAQKVTTIVATQGSNRSTTAGIRGEMARGAPDVRWEVDDAASYLEAGRRAIEEANYDRAILEFQSAREYADADQAADVAFFLAYTHSLKGDLRRALESLSDTLPGPNSETSGELVLLKGQLLVETYAFRQAVDWLSGYGARIGEGVPDRQLYYMLLAVGYRGLGDPDRSKENLAKAVELDPATDIGRAAAGLLQQG